MAKKYDLAGPVAADYVAVRLGAQHAGVGQQQYRVGRRLRAMPAEEIQANREAQGVRTPHLQLHTSTDLDATAVVKQFRRINRPATNTNVAKGVDQVALAIAANAGVP